VEWLKKAPNPVWNRQQNELIDGAEGKKI